jgi:hypothetical protein
MTLPETVENILQEAGLQSYLDEVLAALSSGTGPTTRDGMYAYRIVLQSPRWQERTRKNPEVPSTPWSAFTGQRVALAYNLNVCPPGRDVAQGTPCWTVRAVGSSKGQDTVKQSDILGYTPDVLVKDCSFVLNRGLLERKRAAGKKDVFAFVVGTAVPMSPSPRGLPKTWRPVGFNPLAPPKGLGEDGFKIITPKGRIAVDSLDWFFGAGRKAMGSVSTVRSNGSVTVSDLYEALEHGPDLTDI